MKKILILKVLLLFAMELFAQLKDDVGHTVTSWSNWTTTGCHKGIAWRLRQNYYSGNNNGYAWEYEVKNTYGRQVSFSFQFSESDVNSAGSPMRKTLAHNQVYRNTTLPNARQINYFVFSVCFSADGRCKDGCYSPCDNGTPNIPDCAGSVASSNSRTTPYSSTTQTPKTYTTPQQTKAQQKADALNVLSNSLMDLAKSFDKAKTEKKEKQEKEQMEAQQQSETSVMEQNWQYAQQLAKEDKYAEAIKIMLPYANANKINSMSLGTIGFWYQKIDDYQNALYFYKRGIDDSCALHNLGALYEAGNGVQRNLETALVYYKKACNMGDKTGCDWYTKLKTALDNKN